MAMAQGQSQASVLYALFSQPVHRVWIVWFRIIVFGTTAYRNLSCDFSHYAIANQEILQMYPYYLRDKFLGLPSIVDVATFHWLHWFIPFPNADQLQFIQLLTVALCVSVIFFGKRRYAWLALGSYMGITYLWGYVWRSGAPVEGSFLPMTLILAYIFTDIDEPRLAGKKHSPLLVKDRKTGQFFSIVLIAFIAYYFMSGLNKISYLTFAQWLQFDIYESFHYYRTLTEYAKYPKFVPEYFKYVIVTPLIDYAVPVVYISHLLIPVMFFYRKLIYHFLVFYIIFHIISLAMYIYFINLIFTWLVMLPVGAWLQFLASYFSEKRLTKDLLQK